MISETRTDRRRTSGFGDDMKFLDVLGAERPRLGGSIAKISRSNTPIAVALIGERTCSVTSRQLLVLLLCVASVVDVAWTVFGLRVAQFQLLIKSHIHRQ